VSGDPAPVKAGSWRWREAALLGAAFAALALALYAPSYGGPFVSDDYLYLEHNEALALPLGAALRRILIERYFCMGNWSPLHQLWLLFEWQLFGDHPLPYRIANVLLHAAVSLGFVAAGRRAGLAPRAAVAAGLIFLVHPVAAEVVAWINQSKTLLAVGLCLLALERWLAYLREGLRRQLVAATAAGVLALLAKPAALPLPAILLAAAWTHGRSVPRAALDLIPLAFFAAITLALNLAAQSMQGGVAPWFGGSPAATARMLPWIAWRYVRVTAAPFDLVHGVHPEPTHGWGDARIWLPLAGLAGVAALATAAVRARRGRALGAAWFALMLLPVVQLIPMIEVFADRYLYAALPGALGLVADVADAWARRAGRRAALGLAAASAAACLGLGAITVQRAALWGNPEALYREAADGYPLGRTGWTGLGAERHRKGDLDGAAAAYLRSLAVHPEDGHVRQLLGRVRLRQQQYKRALYDLEESLRLAPDEVDADWTRRMVRQLRSKGVEPQEDPTG
jgi:protein O-mannosyl-transferase